MFSFDLFTNSIFANIDNPIFSGVFYFASWLFNPIPFICILIISVLTVYKIYGKQQALVFVLSSLIAFVMTWALKLSVHSARPIDERIYAFGPAFPSGHTAVATAYFLSILYFARRTVNTYRRYIHILFCTLCPLFVGVSRLYLGVHWLSDVLAGYIIGAFSLYIGVYSLRRFFK